MIADRRRAGEGSAGTHLSASQWLVAVAVNAAAAALWGWLSHSWTVVVWVLTTQSLFAWWTPSHEETLMRRIGTAFVTGGMWAAFGMLLRRM